MTTFLRQYGIDEKTLCLLLENSVNGQAIIDGITEHDLVEVGIDNHAAEVIRLFEVMKQQYNKGLYHDYSSINR